MSFRQSDLEAYLDEALPPEETARIEQAVRTDRDLVRRLAEINAQRGAGLHSVGEIWRRHRLSCPTRQQLGSYLLGALPDDLARYVTFHLDVVGCRYCQANLADLKDQQAEAEEAIETRRRKYFQSSVGHLRREK
jgi:anti-sigma factor RsiW